MPDIELEISRRETRGEKIINDPAGMHTRILYNDECILLEILN